MTHHFDSKRTTLSEELIYRDAKSQAAFLKRVNAAHDAHWQDVQQARKEVPIEAQARRIHAAMWEECHRLNFPVTKPAVIAAANAHTRAGIIMGGLWLDGDMCWFRVQAPADKQAAVKVALHSVWSGAPISITNGIIRVTVPRANVTRKREVLRGLLADAAQRLAA